jgi:glutathione S-transferase
MILLHYFPGNASLIPHIVLEELGVAFALEKVDRANMAHKSPEYLRLNPNGLIPVLVDGDLVLYETAAICMHLADTHPQAGLLPAVGTAARAHATKWLTWMTNTLQATLLLYFYPERWVDEGNAAGAAQVKSHAESKVDDLLGQLEAQLASSGGPWLMGADYGVVDAYALVLCRWTRGFARPARALPRLGPYLERVLARLAVQKAFATEGLGAPFV